MQYIYNQRYDETSSINFIGSDTISHNEPYSRTLILKTEPIKGLTKILSLKDTIVPNSDNIIKKFKYKLCDVWSDLLTFDELTNIEFNPYCYLELEVHYYFVNNGDVNAKPTTISNISIECSYELEKTSGLVTLTESNKPVILEPTDVYKIFDLEDFQVSVGGMVDENDLDIKYRITQDGGYTYTQWENLNKENISTVRKYINELRFAKVQYLIQRTENSSNPITVYDIMLIGDFQNVSANGLKTNRYGLREDCASKLISTDSILSNTSDTNGLSCYSSNSNKGILDNLTNQNSENNGLWSPYAQSPQITNFYSFLANQTNSIFGWDVDYYKSSPDNNGIDYQLHEYGLFNIKQLEKIKVIVPENKFPENTLQINQFNLDLFETFEIHILKDEFKSKFGIEERPAVNDILYFCSVNRLFYVKHSQIFKDVMNAGIYYKVILEKYETKANIQFKEGVVKDSIDQLTDNTAIDSLFGFEKKIDEDKISNKDQVYTKSMDKIRLSVSNKISIISEKVYNGENDFIQYYYDFSKMVGHKVVEYKNADNALNTSDNRTFMNWFKFNSHFDEDKGITSKIFNSYDVNPQTNYVLLDNYSKSDNLGYLYNIKNGKLYFTINTITHELSIPKLYTNVWYCAYISMNQRQGTLDLKILKRNSTVNVVLFHPNSYERMDIESNDTIMMNETLSDGYKPVSNYEYVPNAVSKFIEVCSISVPNVNGNSFMHNESIKLIGSDICYTNLRIFDDVIDSSTLDIILNQNIIRDAGHLIVADNANKKIYTNNIPTKQFS